MSGFLWYCDHIPRFFKGHTFLKTIQPFIWSRPSWNFWAILGLRSKKYKRPVNLSIGGRLPTGFKSSVLLCCVADQVFVPQSLSATHQKLSSFDYNVLLVRTWQERCPGELTCLVCISYLFFLYRFHVHRFSLFPVALVASDVRWNSAILH